MDKGWLLAKLGVTHLLVMDGARGAPDSDTRGLASADRAADVSAAAAAGGIEPSPPARSSAP